MSAYDVFSAAQLIEHDHLWFVGILVSGGIDQVLVDLKVIEKDHGDTGGTRIDELAWEETFHPRKVNLENRVYTHHVLCTNRSPASTCTSLSAGRHCQAMATALGQEEGAHDSSFSEVRKRGQCQRGIR